MDWGFIIIAVLGITGAGLIVGGIVAYRGSARTGVRASGAAAIAAGVVMWVIITLVIPTSVTRGDGPLAPTAHSEPAETHAR